MKRVLCEKVGDEYDGKTADVYLRFEMKISGTLIKKIKRTPDGLTVNGKLVYTNYVLSSGDKICVVISDENEKSENIPPCDGTLDVVYEDDDILVINKTQIIPVHPSIGHYDVSIAGMVIKYYLDRGENFVFRCVNRLDKGTTGLMVIAKHAHAHELLKQQLHTNSFEREYMALVTGTLFGSGVIDAKIARADDSVIKRCVSDIGEYALTEYEVIKNCGDNTLVRLVLKTGRTHQIRVHMAHIGHALYGDFLYGDECDDICRPALHSSKIMLTQPLSGERLVFTSQLPEDINDLMKRAK